MTIERIEVLEKQSCNQSSQIDKLSNSITENSDKISNGIQANQHNIEILGKHIYKILSVVENLDE